MSYWLNSIGVLRATYVAALLIAGLPAAALLTAAAARAIEIIEAADHAELSVKVSSLTVNRIALEGDRIASATPSSDAFTVEHDPVRGDLYLYPTAAWGSPPPSLGDSVTVAADAPSAAPTVTLYLGTEKGFTYRLSLTPVARDSAQILIRNRSLERERPVPSVNTHEGREQMLARLIKAAARRQPLPDYVVVQAPIFPGAPPSVDNASRLGSLLEIWRGPRFTARVLAVPDEVDAESIAEVYGPGLAAVWIAPGESGSAERLSTEYSMGEGSSTDRSTTDKSPTDRSSAERPSGDSPSGESPQDVEFGPAGTLSRLAVVVKERVVPEGGL